jgi:hypothetical protein
VLTNAESSSSIVNNARVSHKNLPIRPRRVASAPAGFFHALRPASLAALLAAIVQPAPRSTIVVDAPAGRIRAFRNGRKSSQKHPTTYRSLTPRRLPLIAETLPPRNERLCAGLSGIARVAIFPIYLWLLCLQVSATAYALTENPCVVGSIPTLPIDVSDAEVFS